MALHALAVAWSALILSLGYVSWRAHLSMLTLFSVTAIFLARYRKWLVDKPRSLENAIIGIFGLLAVVTWLLGALGVAWASAGRFFALIYLAMAVGGLIYLRHLPRVRAWGQQ